MELKVHCPCGTKFKFDVEPVNGRLPAAINCPSCGSDVSEAVNEVLRQQSVEAASPAPVASAAPSGGLRINRPAAPVSAPPPAYNPPPAPMRMPAPAGPKPQSPVKKILTACAVVIALALGAWKIGYKLFKGFREVADVASAIGEAVGNDSSGTAHQNLWYEDCVVLFIKHTNHLEIADACKGYWKETLHKTLVNAPESELQKQGEYTVVPAHNGYVRIVSGLEWPNAQFEGVSKFLSQKFNTLVFEMKEVDFSGVYHFGVYEQGSRKFHAQMDFKIVKGEAEEIVTTEGNDWAIAHGYKPGEEGFKEFYLDDADEITQRMGMKLWDEPNGTQMKGLRLKEQ